MKDLKSIVVGIDYSENSENALREASRIANSSDAKLVCLHVLEEEMVEIFRSNKEFDEPEVLETALRHLESFVSKTIGAGHDIGCQVRVGHPFQEVFRTIDSTRAELLVLGSHGLKGSDPQRTGTLASRCIRKAPIDVLLVRERQHEPFSNIVACVDFSDNSIRAAHRAAEIALQDNAALELLHVFRSPVYDTSEMDFGSLLPPVDTEGLTAKLRGDLEQLSEEIGAACDGCEVRATILEWPVVSGGILRRLKDVGADLAVLGTRGRTGFKGLLLGTSAEHIIHRSPCSVLGVKPEGFRYEL